MKILMLGWEFPPFKSGGLGTYLYGFTKSLAQKNIEITFVMPRTESRIDPGFIKIIQPNMKLVGLDGISLTPYLASIDLSEGTDSDESSKKAYGWDFFNEVKRFTFAAVRAVKNESCDVIHCHDWMTFPAGIALKKQKQKPLIVTIHSTEFDRTGNLSPHPAITEVEYNGLKEADRIITVSNYMKKQLIERYSIPEEKITVVHNAVEKNEYSLRERTSFGLKEKIVLFLGRLTIQKGPDWFLEAAYRVLKASPDTRFVIVGDGDMLPELINKSIAMGISDKVIFTGFKDDVLKFYGSADLFVMSSVSEPFGLTALEAMASGTPTIISKQSGVSEVVNHCMKVDFWDSDEMANKILGVLNYESMRKEMKHNSLIEVQKFSWDDVAEKCLNIYKEVA
ncbi:MAG: glycosyltransferase family 4 protein [archaeon]